jgi:magnesium transporter
MKHEAGRIENVVTLEECQIVRAVAPTQQEISILQNALHIPADFLMAAMDRDERPRIEIEDPCRLVILRIPHQDDSSDTPYVTLALALILTPTHIVTVCSQESMFRFPDLGRFCYDTIS